MKKALAGLFVAVATLANAAGAEPPEQCAASFHARHVETRKATAAQSTYMAEYNRAMPWFNEHCRFLSELERVARKLDDPNAFVCDPAATGRPAGLTHAFVDAHLAPAEIEQWQSSSAENIECAKVDPVSLDLRDPPEPPTPEDDRDIGTKRVHQLWEVQSLARKLAATCYGATGAPAKKCDKQLSGLAEMASQLEAQIEKLKTEQK